MCDEKKKSMFYRGCTGDIIQCPLCSQRVCNYHGASNNGGLKGGHGGCAGRCAIKGALKATCTGYMTPCGDCGKHYCRRHTLCDENRGSIGTGHVCKVEAQDEIPLSPSGDSLNVATGLGTQITPVTGIPKAWAQRVVDELKLPGDVSVALADEGIDDVETLVEYTKDALVRLGIKGGHAVKLIAHANKTTGREEANANAASPRRVASLNAPSSDGQWDFFISHTQRSGHATTMAAELYGDLREAGCSVWLDVKMDLKSADAMRDGVTNSTCCLAIITGSCLNPDRPEDDETANAYFNREYCVQELRWAREAGVFIQPIIRMEDKQRIGEFLQTAPVDLQDLGATDFIDLIRSDKRYWQVGVEKILDVLSAHRAIATTESAGLAGVAE